MKVGDASVMFMNPVTKLPCWRCRSDPASKAFFSKGQLSAFCCYWHSKKTAQGRAERERDVRARFDNAVESCPEQLSKHVCVD
jgi:hypothetical protein